MLQTIKQLKGTFNFNLYLEGGASSPNFSEKLKNETNLNEKWIKEHKDEIIKFINEKKGNDEFIGLADFGNESESWKEIVVLMETLGVVKNEKNEYSVNKTLDILNKFVLDSKKVIDETKNDKDKLNKDLIISNFDEKKYSSKKSYPEVKELQKALGFKGKDVDGYLGSKTKKALNEARKPSLVLKTDKVNIYTTEKGSETVFPSDETPLNGNKKTFDDARKSVEVAKGSLDELKFRIETTRELNVMLGKYDFASNRGFSIENGIRNLLGKGKYNEVSKVANNKEAIFNSKEGKQKIANAIEFLRSPKDTKENDDHLTRNANSNILNNILKAAPWIFGVYLGDIPLPVMKKMMPGVDLNRSIPFKEWLNSGMPGEFKDYLKTKPAKSPEPIKDLISLRAVLSKTDLTSEEQARILSGDLTGLDKSTKDLLVSYIKELLVPNLKILKDDSFTIFSYFGKKHGGLRKIISELEAQASSGDLVGYEKKLSKAIEIIRKENDTDMSTVDKIEAGDKYMERITGHNEEVQKLNELSKMGERIFNDYNKIFALTNINSLVEIGSSASDKKSLGDLVKILSSKSISKEDLLAWEKSNPSTHNFVKSLGDKEAMKKYHLSSIPRKDGLKYVEVGSDYQQQRRHGRDLSKFSNDEALIIAESETPEKGSNISTLGFAYKTFIEQAGISGISYEDFRNAFKNKTSVDINSLTKENIYNTGRGGTNKLTSFAELAKKGDKEVFKLAPIEKSYSYYEEDGREITVKVSYDLYLRTDCTNPLIVPNTVKVTKAGKIVPEGELVSIAQTKRKLPVVIPWTLFIKPGTPKIGGKTVTGEVNNSINNIDPTGAASSGKNVTQVMEEVFPR